MSYSHLVISLWVVVVVSSLFALGLAWRALRRLEASLVGLRTAADGVREMKVTSVVVEAVTGDVGRARVALHTRAPTDPA